MTKGHLRIIENFKRKKATADLRQSPPKKEPSAKKDYPKKVKEIEDCERDDLVFPCKRAYTVFNNMKEYQEYISLKKPGPYLRADISDVAKRANKELRK